MRENEGDKSDDCDQQAGERALKGEHGPEQYRIIVPEKNNTHPVRISIARRPVNCFQQIQASGTSRMITNMTTGMVRSAQR